MDIHNLAVCMTPNLFHTKQNSKCVQQQTTAIEISIQNVLNIGKHHIGAHNSEAKHYYVKD